MIGAKGLPSSYVLNFGTRRRLDHDDSRQIAFDPVCPTPTLIMCQSGSGRLAFCPSNKLGIRTSSRQLASQVAWTLAYPQLQPKRRRKEGRSSSRPPEILSDGASFEASAAFEVVLARTFYERMRSGLDQLGVESILMPEACQMSRGFLVDAFCSVAPATRVAC